jgi:hypothetical protein
MEDLRSIFKMALAENMQSNTLTCCSRWAAKRRMMGTPISGPYGFKYHPWAKEIHDTRAAFIVALKAAQTGFTEIGINRAFYTLDILKQSVLYCLPTTLNASDFSKSRFGPALAHSPYLKSLFVDTNTVALKTTSNGSNLYIRGTRGDSNLKSIPVSNLVLDEVDEMSQRAIYLALERLSGQWKEDKSIFCLSTPTLPGFGVHKMYLNTTQEHFCFQCPHCSRMTELIWPDSFELRGDHVNDPDCFESYIKCKECQAKLDHQTKYEWLSDGLWTPTNTNGDSDNRGFYINQLYSSTVEPGEIAVAHYRTFGDEAAAQEFHNSKLGQPFLGDSALLTDDKFDDCIASHSMQDFRPTDSSYIITMGVDQGKWSYVEIDLWYTDELSNDLNVAAKPKVLWVEKFHEESEGGWDRLDELMVEWQVHACVIDADPNIYLARRFARRFPGFVWLCRYRKGPTGREIQISDSQDYAPIATVHRTNWMDIALRRFHTKKIMLPTDIKGEYKEHMKNQVRKYSKDPTGNYIAEYVEIGPDHYSHARTYSEIALPMAASLKTNRDIKAFL